jgi:hypothetical protein
MRVFVNACFSGLMCGFPAHASGISMAMTCGMLRRLEQQFDGIVARRVAAAGFDSRNSFFMSSPNSGDARIDCRACIHATFPFSVLISPLCAHSDTDAPASSWERIG